MVTEAFQLNQTILGLMTELKTDAQNVLNKDQNQTLRDISPGSSAISVNF